MATSRLLVLCVALATVLPAVSAEGDEALAERFVRAMKLDEQSQLGLRMAADNLRKLGKLTDAHVECIRQIPAEEFVPLMKQLAMKQLTGTEMQEAIGFFESSAGQKYLQLSAVKSAEMAGVKLDTPMPEFTSKETRATNQFGTTAVYQKLATEAIMTRSALARPQLNAKIGELLQRCVRS